MPQSRVRVHMHAYGNLLTNRPRSVTLPLDLSHNFSSRLSFASTIVRHPRERERKREVFTPGPGGFRYEITAALMDSEVATISMRRNNVTLIYLRFNPVGFA